MGENIFQNDTRICPDCGQDIPLGLRDSISHWDVCKRDAPNESIESHRIQEKYKETAQKKENRINAVWPKMTDDEKFKLVQYSMSGTYDYINNVMYMGVSTYIRLDEFREEMIAKYS